MAATAGATPATPRVGEVIRRLRTQRGLSVRGLAAFRVPGTHLELLVATFEPGTQFDDVVTHAGIDVMYITKGELVLVVEGEDYALHERGVCGVAVLASPYDAQRFRRERPRGRLHDGDRLLMTEMRLYDIRVTVERIEGRSVCGLEVGDYFEVTESNRLRIPDGRHFCLYALQAVLPLIPAKQRQLAAEDWLERDNLVCCPDPDERVIMRIERTRERTLITEDLT